MSKRRIALVVLGDIFLFIAVIMLLQIDQLVNGTLYYYGLIYSDAWAQPYLLMFRICVILIVSAIFLMSVVELPYPAFEEKD
jgi:hypothetical protein